MGWGWGQNYDVVRKYVSVVRRIPAQAYNTHRNGLKPLAFCREVSATLGCQIKPLAGDVKSNRAFVRIISSYVHLIWPV